MRSARDVLIVVVALAATMAVLALSLVVISDLDEATSPCDRNPHSNACGENLTERLQGCSRVPECRAILRDLTREETR